MERLDFSRYQSKYPLLKASDISFLNNFFNQKEVFNFLWEQEKIRKKVNKITLWITGILLLIILGIGLYSNEFSIESFLYFCIFLIMFYFIIYFITKIIVLLFFNFSDNVKDKILPNFVKSIDKNVSYSKTKKFFKDSLSSIITSGLMKTYSRLDKHEDSILYNLFDKKGNNGITIEGSEVKTSQKKTTRTKNGTRTYYVTSNHFYLLKVKYSNAKYKFKKYIRLLEDINDNIKKKLTKVFGFLLIGIFAILHISGESLNILIDFIVNLSDKVGLPTYIFVIVILLFLFGVIYHIYSYIIGRKRVKLENIDFEKEFDVYSEDKIESRILLTPSFMYRLVDYVNKISRKRVYELFFKDDYFYVKYDILKTGKSTKGYMEFSNNKNIYKNLEDYIEFYLEIKNIVTLVNDLKLFYYNKGSY